MRGPERARGFLLFSTKIFKDCLRQTGQEVIRSLNFSKDEITFGGLWNFGYITHHVQYLSEINHFTYSIIHTYNLQLRVASPELLFSAHISYGTGKYLNKRRFFHKICHVPNLYPR